MPDRRCSRLRGIPHRAFSAPFSPLSSPGCFFIRCVLDAHVMIQIGPLEVDVERREVFLDGRPVRLGSRAFDMLAVLIAANGGLVSKNELLKQVWPNAIVEENNLQVHMSALRKMLGESR